jgi:hypothetical protein
VCGGIVENDRCGSTDIAGVDEGKNVRPLIKGYFSALRWSRVRSCLRPSFAENRIRWAEAGAAVAT